LDRIHGWQNYDSRRYNGKYFPLSVATFVLALMVWSAVPDSPPAAQAEAAPLQTQVTVAHKQQWKTVMTGQCFGPLLLTEA